MQDIPHEQYAGSVAGPLLALLALGFTPSARAVGAAMGGGYAFAPAVVGLAQAFEAKREALKAEGNAIVTLATSSGGYSQEQRDRQSAILAELDQIDKDLAMQAQADRLLATAPATSILDPIGPAQDNKPPTPFRSLGEQMRAVATATITGQRDTRLDAIQDWARTQAAAGGANESVPADGGFLVQQDQTDALLSLTHDTGVLSSRARRVPIGPNANGLKANLIKETSRATGSRFGAVRVYREGEADPTTASRPKFRQIDLSLYKLMGLFYATDELLQDTTALTAIASTAFQEEFGWQIDDEIYNGSGAGEMLGILNAGALVTVAKESGQEAASLYPENIFKMLARVPAANLGSSAWFINQDVWPAILGLAQTIGLGGVPLYLEPGRLPDTPNGSILGRPIVPIEQAATLGTVGDIVLADLSQYLIIEKGGPQMASSIHVEFLTAQQVFRWIVRNNGQPIPESAITPANGSNTQSPFVALATRA